MNLTEILEERIKERSTLRDLMLEKGYKYIEIIRGLEENYSNEQIEAYFSEFIEMEFTKKRIKVTNNLFSETFFGRNSAYLKESELSRNNYGDFISSIINKHLEIQKEQFINTNKVEMSLNKESWVLYFLKGPSLNKRDFNFNKILSPQLRREVKMYMKYILEHEENFRNDRGLALLITACNYFTANTSEIKHFRDIKEVHARKLVIALENGELLSERNDKYSIESIRKMIQKCSMVINYLMNVDNYAFKPRTNELESINFNNVSNMNKNTEIIPEEVALQLDNYIAELNQIHGLIYQILSETGMRIKEVTHLTEFCLKQSGREEYMFLRFTPYKNLNHLKRIGQNPTSEVAISIELANKINQQIENTSHIREKTGLSFIFYGEVTSSNRERYSLIQEGGFVNAINRLIKTKNITTQDGILWKYTSRQSRKTLAVTLVEQGASTAEISMQFGHSNSRTTATYYAEVRKKKLAEMNSEFFKKKFQVFIGEDNLKEYTEEERRHLYADFALNSREVEFGKCSKHMSEGPCGVRTGAMSCATCSKLCTGVKYLEKWVDLISSQKMILNELIKTYELENIAHSEYEEFIEYKREQHLLLTYESVKNAIENTV